MECWLLLQSSKFFTEELKQSTFRAPKNLIRIKLYESFAANDAFVTALTDVSLWDGENPKSIGSRGPTISALDPWAPSAGRMRQLLTDDERAQLAVMSSIVRFKKRETIYLEGDPAEAIFNINAGVVKVYKVATDGREHITALLFSGDLFGLSAEGTYANSTKAITDVIAYRLPVTMLRRHLAKDTEFDFHVIASCVRTCGTRNATLFCFRL